jgi:carbon-monoxide dehydrogenase medium subunit
MKLPDFEYRAPETLGAALEMLAALGTDAKILAGGQSLLATMRYGLARPTVLLDVKRVPSLRGTRTEAGGLAIGAMTTHADLARAAQNTQVASLLAAHAVQIAFPAVRTRGTVGGSLVHADPAGDWPLLFSALDARVELRSLRGRRHADLNGFILGPLSTEIEIDELLTGVLVDSDNTNITAWGRAKLMHRAGEFATTSAVALRRASGKWSCWFAAPAVGPRSMPGCAALLDEGHPADAGLMALALEETAGHLPGETASGIHRHAANLVRAINHALEGRHD